MVREKRGKSEKGKGKGKKSKGGDAQAEPPLERADIALRSAGAITTIIDVTIRVVPPKGEAGRGACNGEAAKNKVYKRWNLHDVQMVPFALERNGTWGAQATAFVEKVGGAGCHTELERSNATWQLVGRIAVALQRGNARFAESRLHSMLTAMNVPVPPSTS